MLGSPEHRVRRAIASYRHAGAWEVAKISFGAAGAGVLGREARVLEELQALAAGVPRLLGLHHGGDATLLRMPYLTGKPIAPGEFAEALGLLGRWNTNRPLAPITGFPEWTAIGAALSVDEVGRGTLERLAGEMLRPVICHGDFARWNLLRQGDGKLLVLDWEWGHTAGLPGVDLVHYFLQDARLVRRLNPAAAIEATLRDLTRPACMAYLAGTGWSAEPLLAIIASLAYKQGAGHQDNRDVLAAALACSWRAGVSPNTDL